jgi:poly(A) polymerase/tRNA nucleotidyltransferase (CCA-adding enzyme)
MSLPQEVKSIIERLEKTGFQAFAVGGCVRDTLLGLEPQDWDIATSAKPEEIQKVFPDSFYENKFLTVTVLTDSQNPRLKEVEVTTYRQEAEYSDQRHPDQVNFASSIEEDLARRDFTVNAMALKIKNGRSQILDIFDGQKDLKNKIIKTVGDPQARFTEDALRLMRAVRFAVTLNFKVEDKTFQALRDNAHLLEAVSKERVRDEFVKIAMSERAAQGIELLRESGLLKYIIPELEEGVGCSQNKHHIYDCYQHNLKSFEYAVKENFNKYVRLAALFHDVAKPRSKRGEGPDATFYGHEVLSAKMTWQILNRLKFPKKEIEKIVKLVRYHLFYYNVGEVGESSVRRLVLKVGAENVEELLQLRMADRIGSGVPKAEPYKLRHLKYIIDKVSQDPISVKMLKINGQDIMKILSLSPGPKVGLLLDILLGYVLIDPEKNEEKFLQKEVKKLGKLSEKELTKLANQAQTEREKVEMKKDEMTKKKYWVT